MSLNPKFNFDTLDRSTNWRKSHLKSGCELSSSMLVTTSARDTAPEHLVMTKRLPASTKC